MLIGVTSRYTIWNASMLCIQHVTFHASTITATTTTKWWYNSYIYISKVCIQKNDGFPHVCSVKRVLNNVHIEWWNNSSLRRSVVRRSISYFTYRYISARRVTKKRGFERVTNKRLYLRLPTVLMYTECMYIFI